MDPLGKESIPSTMAATSDTVSRPLKIVDDGIEWSPIVSSPLLTILNR